MTTLRILAAAAITTAATALPALAQDVAYDLINNTGLTLMEFYTSPASTDEWGADILGSEVVAPGGSGTVTITDGEATCDYDLLFVFEDGTEFTDSVDICSMASYTLNQ